MSRWRARLALLACLALLASPTAARAVTDSADRSVPPSGRPRVYLACGPDGLETGSKGSINTEIIERVGGPR